MDIHWFDFIILVIIFICFIMPLSLLFFMTGIFDKIKFRNVEEQKAWDEWDTRFSDPVNNELQESKYK